MGTMLMVVALVTFGFLGWLIVQVWRDGRNGIRFDDEVERKLQDRDALLDLDARTRGWK